MEESNIQKYSNATFDTALCQLYADIIMQDADNVKVFFYVASCNKDGKQVTVKIITDHVKTMRRVAVKDMNNKLVSFVNKEEYIDRKKAERIVERLVYASLVYYNVQRPFKFIELSARGLQVLRYIKQREK